MTDFDEHSKYNFIFNQIVENDDDFVGSLAYVLYKRNKIEYIEQYKKEHGGKEPELSELREWQKGECVKSKLENYKKLAEQKTTAFVNNLQGEKDKQLLKRQSELAKNQRELREREKQIKEKEKSLRQRDTYCHVKPQKGKYWIGVSQSLVASFLFIIISFLVLISISGNADIVAWLKSLLVPFNN